jgi:hypothetical protein
MNVSLSKTNNKMQATNLQASYVCMQQTSLNEDLEPVDGACIYLDILVVEDSQGIMNVSVVEDTCTKGILVTLGPQFSSDHYRVFQCYQDVCLEFLNENDDGVEANSILFDIIYHDIFYKTIHDIICDVTTG